ncbi:hypothetical protein [Trichormus sp. NMC-1]|uniref:hypothetical protein n=1 Tax=Trichormus sp. NMC-1 TaxID=1853259 RepID=UPI0015A56456|nr:hypothetical protein [Trichormus sp. NMC-1]
MIKLVPSSWGGRGDGEMGRWGGRGGRGRWGDGEEYLSFFYLISSFYSLFPIPCSLFPIPF